MSIILDPDDIKYFQVLAALDRVSPCKLSRSFVEPCSTKSSEQLIYKIIGEDILMRRPCKRHLDYYLQSLTNWRKL